MFSAISLSLPAHSSFYLTDESLSNRKFRPKSSRTIVFILIRFIRFEQPIRCLSVRKSRRRGMLCNEIACLPLVSCPRISADALRNQLGTPTAFQRSVELLAGSKLELQKPRLELGEKRERQPFVKKPKIFVLFIILIAI